MKREYIAPQLLAVAIETGHILAGSFELQEDGDNVNVIPGGGGYSGSDWTTRPNRDLWADDEDEED